MPDYSLFGDEHVRQDEATDGKVGHDWNDTSCLVLRTKGRKSGKTRKFALISGGRDGDDYQTGTKRDIPVVLLRPR